MATINVEVQATIRRPLAVVSRQFGDMRHHERHRVHPDISFTVLSEDGGDCRFRQEVRLLGMLQSDEIVQHRNADGSLSSEVVTGANKGLRIHQAFAPGEQELEHLPVNVVFYKIEQRRNVRQLRIGLHAELQNDPDLTVLQLLRA